MKKIIAAVLSVVSLTSLGFAVACDKEPDYYTLTYETDGVTFDFGDIQSGAEVKEGYEVTFTYTAGSNMIGEGVVEVNGEVLNANDEGVYSFVMSKDTVVEVSGLTKVANHTVTFDKGDNRITFKNTKGEEIESVNIEYDETISFTVDKSVYYGDNEFAVLANTTILEPKNGVYSYTLKQNNDVTISVRGYSEDGSFQTSINTDTSFLSRDDGGSGTAADPYKISRPIDLYVIADLVNDDFYLGTYASAYYELVNDIDMQGEQLYIIGDATTDYAFFSGDFNGNGHKITNYYISDTIIEQSDYTDVFMPYIGLFGRALATSTRSPKIYNLTLEDFEIEINANKYSSTYFAGGLVGLGIGVEITNCSVSGTISADSDLGYFGYIGGVIGYQQSAYSSSTLRYYSKVSGCSSNVAITGESGYLYAAGGIAGILSSYEENTTAYIVNCTSTGNIIGAMSSGGIVGRMTPYSSIKNCYAIGNYVDAYSSVGLSTGNEQYAYAYAGGIVGYADYDSIVSNCFATTSSLAYAEADKYAHGVTYSYSGNIVGYLVTSSDYIESSAALSLNNVSSNENGVNITADFIKSTLGWSIADWAFDGTYPSINTNNTTNAVNVTIVLGSTNVNLTLNGYKPMSAWYTDDDNTFSNQEISKFANTVEGDKTLRTFGYYFDAKLTQKVPNSYVLTGGETLYAGYADYSQVAGVYYVVTSVNGSGINIELTTDGKLIYRDGAFTYTSYYIYDGSQITLYECPAIIETDDSDEQYYGSAVATLADGVLTIKNNLSYRKVALRAVKELSDFTYGSYFAADGTVYTFYKDGTGYVGSNAISYVIRDGKVYIYNNGNLQTSGTISTEAITLDNASSTVISAYDNFKGTWEKSSTSHKRYTFDGVNSWSYEYFVYNNGFESVVDKKSGTYTRNANVLTLNDNTVVSFDSDGFLSIGGQTYYQQSSYVGTWKYFNSKENIEVTLNGVGNAGCGTASIKYSTGSTLLDDMTYDIRQVGTTNYIYIFKDGVNYARLYYNTNNETLSGTIYSLSSSAMVSGATLCLYDDYTGEWIDSQLGTLTFNGFGSYNLSRTSSTLAVNGTVTISSSNGSNIVRYTTTSDGTKRQFTYNDVTYTVSYNELDGTVSVTSSGDRTSFTITRLDDWADVQLVDSNKTLCTFDGGGNLSDGGVLTYGEQKYTYKINGSQIVISGSASGSIVVDNGEYKMTLGGREYTLKYKNVFDGEWVIGASLNDTLEVGDISASKQASGTFKGTEVVYTYNVADNTLSFTYTNKTYYLIPLTSGSTVELVLSETNDYNDGITCIKQDELDSVRGKYTAADGSYMILDGLGNSKMGEGTAILYRSNGAALSTYSYYINNFGMVVLNNGTTYIFNNVTNGTYKLEGDNTKAYSIVRPDSFYGKTATQKDGTVKFAFDGVGGVWEVVSTSNYRKVYTYTYKSADSVNLTYTFEFVDTNGKVRTAVYDYGTDNVTLEIT